MKTAAQAPPSQPNETRGSRRAGLAAVFALVLSLRLSLREAVAAAERQVPFDLLDLVCMAAAVTLGLSSVIRRERFWEVGIAAALFAMFPYVYELLEVWEAIRRME